MELEAVLFDAGGVLWDLDPPVEELFARALGRHGAATDRGRLMAALAKAERLMDGEFARIGGGDERDYWLEYDGIVLDDLGIETDVGAFAAGLGREFRAVVTRMESWVAYPDAVPALEAVRRMGLRAGLVSNATELARRVLVNLDMERHFDAVVISDEVGVRKPNPEIFRIALGMLGAEPGRSVFLGDRPATDMAGAERAGVLPVLVDRRGAFHGSGYERVDGLSGIEGLVERLRSRPAPAAGGP
ncbi:MAG: HAD family hydrolase [Candidatus Thermoplasmatota archaeon]